MNYRILAKPRAQKALDDLSLPEQERVSAAIDDLAENPRPAGCRKMKSENAWRIRVGRYRVIYEVDDPSQVVVLLHVGHRKDVYR